MMKMLANNQFLGQMLGRYAVEQLVGQGRLSDVYAVRHVVHGDVAALTAFHLPDSLTEEEKARFVARFHVIAEQLTSLQHHHVLPVLATGTHCGKPYLVTRYMTNGSLATLLTHKTRLALAEVSTLLTQISAGLSYAHAQGMIHGMIHPSLLLLDEQGSWLLSGLGLRQILQRQGIQQQAVHAHWYNMTGALLLPAAYMSPEQLEGRPLSVRSDIYALGVLLAHALSGKAPFQGTTPEAVMREHKTHPLSVLTPFDVPHPGLASVIEKALAYEPASRFASIQVMASACREAIGHATVPPTPHEEGNTPFSLPQEKRFVSLIGEPQEWIFTNEPQKSQTPRAKTPRSQDTDPWKVPLSLRTQSKPTSQKLSRRQTVALLTTAGVIASVAVITGFTTTRQQTTGKLAADVRPPVIPAKTQPLPPNAIGVTSLAINSSKAFHNPKNENASLLVHLPTGTFVAYERACTHTGVYVNYDPTTHTLICPAHGAIFDPAQKGKVLQGPATQSLPTVAVQVHNDGTILAL
jgi:serine/threonine protein kinase